MNRRGFVLGAGALLAAPSIVRAASLMPVSVMDDPFHKLHALLMRRLQETEGELMRIWAPVFERELWGQPSGPTHILASSDVLEAWLEARNG